MKRMALRLGVGLLAMTTAWFADGRPAAARTVLVDVSTKDPPAP